MPEVFHATPTDAAGLGAAMARAFGDDPIWRWLVRDQARWDSRAGKFFTADTANRIRLGHVYTVPGLKASAQWCPPGMYKPTIGALLREATVSLRLFGISLPRTLRFLARTERIHPSKPDHWYLALLGTDPEHQGTGLGSAVLRPILDVCDREGTPAYLESSKESNVPFYRRHGFELLEPLLTDGGPTLYPMWRDPRP